MIQQTKIQFLPAEMELVSSPDDIIQRYLSHLPEEVLKISPKISRGENYKGLPWLVLDNPRYFQHNNIFAIRTMFWWGNFFSITLHVSGNNKNDLLKNLTDNVSLLVKNDFYIYTGIKEWEHDIDPGSYRKLSAINEDELQKIFSANSFLKLAVKFTVESLGAIEGKLLRNYELLVKCCC